MKVNKQIVHESVCTKRHSILSFPVVLVARCTHRKLGINPTVSKYSVATVFIFGGAYMASNPIVGIPHFVVDAIGYSLHGIGLAPLAEAVLRKVEKKVKEEFD